MKVRGEGEGGRQKRREGMEVFHSHGDWIARQ